MVMVILIKDGIQVILFEKEVIMHMKMTTKEDIIDHKKIKNIKDQRVQNMDMKDGIQVILFEKEVIMHMKMRKKEDIKEVIRQH